MDELDRNAAAGWFRHFQDYKLEDGDLSDPAPGAAGRLRALQPGIAFDTDYQGFRSLLRDLAPDDLK